jgi:hypothetical protein
MRPENKCGMPLLPPARAMMPRSYFRHSALQLNFVCTVAFESRRRAWMFVFSNGMSI